MAFDKNFLGIFRCEYDQKFLSCTKVQMDHVLNSLQHRSHTVLGAPEYNTYASVVTVVSKEQ